jgi:uncharacterized membrane protein YesL
VLLAELAGGHPPDRIWAGFWRQWRAGLGRMNLLALPWWLIGALVLLDLQVAVPAGGSIPGLLVGLVLVLVAYLAAVFAFFLAVTRRYDDPIGRTWRFLLVAPLLAPVTSAGIVLVDAVLLTAFTSLSVLVPLAGLALPVLTTGWLADRRLDRLEDQSGSDSSGNPSVDSRATIS